MPQAPRLQLRLASKGAALLRASVAGVPIAIDDTGRGITVQKPLNPWIIPGEPNGFRLDLEWPAGKEVVKGLAFVELTLAVDDGEPIIRYRYPPVAPSGDRDGKGADEPPEERTGSPAVPAEPFVESYPFVFAALFDPPFEPPTRVWHEAERLADLDFETSRAALEAGRALHAALSALDAERASELVDYRTRETAAAFGFDLDELRTDVRRTHAMLAAAPGFNLVPWEEAALQTQLVAGGRVVWITRGYRDAPIRSAKMPGFSFGSPLYVARIAGRWTIVR